LESLMNTLTESFLREATTLALKNESGQPLMKFSAEDENGMRRAFTSLQKNPELMISGTNHLTEALLQERGITVPGVFQMITDSGKPFGEPFSGNDPSALDRSIRCLAARPGYVIKAAAQQAA